MSHTVVGRSPYCMPLAIATLPQWRSVPLSAILLFASPVERVVASFTWTRIGCRLVVNLDLSALAAATVARISRTPGTRRRCLTMFGRCAGNDRPDPAPSARWRRAAPSCAGARIDRPALRLRCGLTSGGRPPDVRGQFAPPAQALSASAAPRTCGWRGPGCGWRGTQFTRWPSGVRYFANTWAANSSRDCAPGARLFQRRAAASGCISIGPEAWQRTHCTS